jgi:hypothetical protein
MAAEVDVRRTVVERGESLMRADRVYATPNWSSGRHDTVIALYPDSKVSTGTSMDVSTLSVEILFESSSSVNVHFDACKLTTLRDAATLAYMRCAHQRLMQDCMKRQTKRNETKRNEAMKRLRHA